MESEKEIKLSFLAVLSEFPMLWKLDHPLYLDRGAKKKAWGDILSEMKAKHGEKLLLHNIDTIDDLHKVYEGLRAGLRQVQSVQKRKLKAGKAQEVTWPYYRAMSFLCAGPDTEEDELLESSRKVQDSKSSGGRFNRGVTGERFSFFYTG